LGNPYLTALFFQEERIVLMKTKRYRIYGCLLLICTIGLSMSIYVSFANGKMPLSDSEMINVHGGLCYPCSDSGTEGCPTGSRTLCGAREHRYQCNGYRTSCRQSEKKCQDKTTPGCTDKMKPCSDKDYNSWYCSWDSDTESCTKGKVNPPRPCWSSRHWCE